MKMNVPGPPSMVTTLSSGRLSKALIATVTTNDRDLSLAPVRILKIQLNRSLKNLLRLNNNFFLFSWDL